MPALAGLDDAGRVVGRQERATREFIERFEAEHPGADPMRSYIYESMMSIAQNVDVQNMKGREVSRNMTSLLGFIQELRAMVAPAGESVEADGAARELLELLAGDPR